MASLECSHVSLRSGAAQYRSQNTLQAHDREGQQSDISTVCSARLLMFPSLCVYRVIIVVVLQPFSRAIKEQLEMFKVCKQETSR